jgi:hypothetical protein
MKRLDFNSMSRAELLEFITRHMEKHRRIGRAAERKRRRKNRVQVMRFRPTLTTRKRRAREAEEARMDTIAMRDAQVAKGRA